MDQAGPQSEPSTGQQAAKEEIDAPAGRLTHPSPLQESSGGIQPDQGQDSHSGQALGTSLQDQTSKKPDRVTRPEQKPARSQKEGRNWNGRPK